MLPVIAAEELWLTAIAAGHMMSETVTKMVALWRAVACCCVWQLLHYLQIEVSV